MKKSFICSLLAVSLLSACATDPYTGESKVSKTAWGTGIGTAAGAGIGAGLGALIGGKKGAIIGVSTGAGAGALLGAGTGAYMDVQAKKLREELLNTGVQVQQVDGQIYLIMPGNITFDSNDASIKPAFNPVLNSIAKVLKEYNKTMIQVNGYTDSTGSAALNNSLSLMRANSISNYLKVQGVEAGRIVANGYGSSNPIASNDTAAGREQNRRVELVLINKQ